MCRLFVFAKADNDHPDPELDWTKFKAGDVIDILEDGQHGGAEAETSGLFHIVELPGVPAAEFHSLLLGDEGHTPTHYQRLRSNRLDLPGIRRAKPSDKKGLLAHRTTTVRIKRGDVL